MPNDIGSQRADSIEPKNCKEDSHKRVKKFDLSSWQLKKVTRYP
ncbi:hypothetical protein [Candidatus Midichloria mitochondrii]|uniref:Uncharacterized protein n=1 Tax=Midichloria mitochondrii (strain IricVA) TaxID=696127 RepID=F7XUM6_MIDMI|nr:hypothetical protein [Candidatus Midichloria mitochondrii]AEI88375.1 hypothetical protein midi_00049 [Candidatus Midichloria mitochondrii IricVA]